MCLTLKSYLLTVFTSFAALMLFLEIIQWFNYVDVGCKTILQILSYKLVCCVEGSGTDCKLINEGLITSIFVPMIKKLWDLALNAFKSRPVGLWQRMFGS